MSSSVSIAVDARPLSFPLTGIGRYTERILSVLIEKTPEWKWFLYSVHELPRAWLKYDNVTVRTVARAPRATSSVLGQVLFPLWCGLDNVSIFWSPRHHLPLLLAVSRVKTVVTVHDLVWAVVPETMSKLGRLLDKLLMPPSVKIADGVCCVSESTQFDLGKYLGCSAPTHMVPPGSFLGASIAEAKPIRGAPYLLFVGTFEPRKNLANLLRAYKAALSKGIPVKRLVLVGGEGWGNLELDSLLGRLGIQAHVEIAGFVDDDQLMELYEGAYALVMPSLYEGFGMPLLEAMSVGVPAITSNRSSMPEVVQGTGLLVDPESVESISQAIVKLTSNLDYRNELSAKAIQAASMYSWGASAGKMLAVFKSLL